MGARQRARRSREATVLQLAMTAILCGLGILLLAGAEMYADHRYDGHSTWDGPRFCYIDQAPEPFLPTCRAE